MLEIKKKFPEYDQQKSHIRKEFMKLMRTRALRDKNRFLRDVEKNIIWQNHNLNEEQVAIIGLLGTQEKQIASIVAVEDTKSRIYILTFHVISSLRNAGIGELLLRQLEQRAKKKGFKYIYTNPGVLHKFSDPPYSVSKDSTNFYKKHGYFINPRSTDEMIKRL